MAIVLKGQFLLGQNVRRLSAAAVEVVAASVKETLEKIHDEASRLVPRDTGDLEQSLRRVLLGENRLTGQVRAVADHALAVEEGYLGVGGRGNRRNKPPLVKTSSGWRPAPALAAWAARHGVRNPFALALRIHRRGHRAQPFLFDALDRHRAAFLAAVRRALEEDLVRVAGIPQGPTTAARVGA